MIFCAAILGFAKEIETIYGTFTCDEPIIIELIESKAMQRLKKVDQHGFSHLSNPPPTFNRFDHSVGVFHLLRHFGASMNEQIAGLLHDVSHTVFSHVGDFVFNHKDGTDSYQDTIHEWHLENNGIKEIFEQHGIAIADIIHKNAAFSLLEKNLPDLCVDRLEYNLRTGFVFGFLTKSDIAQILDDLCAPNGKEIAFKTPAIAKKFSALSLYFTENLWGADWNVVYNIMIARSIGRALEIGIITAKEVHFSDDNSILAKLNASTDEIVSKTLHAAKNYKSAYQHVDPEKATHRIKPKFRGIDPWVTGLGAWTRLTKLDPSYADEYKRVREKLQKGYALKI